MADGVRRAGFAMALAIVLAACQTADSDPLTWQRGTLTIPGAAACDETRISNASCLDAGVGGAEGPVPAVLFLHGCSGINARQYHVFALFTDAGYVTFMPDSFARPNRQRDCGRAYQTIHLRYAEIRYALEQMTKIPWIDQKRLVLAGFSAGGIAAAEYGGDEFKARVVMGWGCGNGVNAGRAVPVLNLVGRLDNETSRGNEVCVLGGRPHSEARHVNAGHDVADDPETRKIVKAFLAKVIGPGR